VSQPEKDLPRLVYEARIALNALDLRRQGNRAIVVSGTTVAFEAELRALVQLYDERTDDGIPTTTT
jgi:hypothetical protein